jgi:Baseplate J-like protein
VSGTSSVPRPTFGPTGFIIPTEAQILAGVQADINAAFGGNLNPALETPQGQLATTETAIIADQNDQFLLLTQMVDPAYSAGRFQDGIGRIYFMERYPALPTVVQGTCRGLQGVVIPAGALALANDGNFYNATAAGVIGPDGTVTLPFQCNVTGPIACPTGALAQVYVVIPGWDSIINNADGEIGQNVETRTQFEYRRFNSVAGNSAGMLASVQGAVLTLPDVLDAYTTENFTDTPLTTDGITIPPHALYVCVSGGSAAEVAQAIFTKKAPGCNMAPVPAVTGTTTVSVPDTNGGYNPPIPTYPITFQYAQPQTFVMTVSIVNSPAVPSDAATQIQNAIINATTGGAWGGGDGGSRARIGSTVYASRYYGPVALLGTWVQLVSIKLGSTAAPTASITGSITGNQLNVTAGPVLAAGQTIVGNNVPDGTQITSIASAGVYNLDTNFATPIPSQAMVTILPALDDVKVGIAHVPVLSQANVNVVLLSAPP